MLAGELRAVLKEGDIKFFSLKYCFVEWGFSAPQCDPVEVCPEWAALTPILLLQDFPGSNMYD